MNTKTKRLALLLAVFALIGIFTLGAFAAEEKTSGDFTYIVQDDGTVKIIGYEGADKDVVIPSELEGKSVSIIGGYAFNSEDNIESMVIPGSVEIIEQKGIYGCSKLTAVTVEKGKLKSILNTSIENCRSLKTVNIPSNVEKIGNFMQCTALENINIDATNTFLKNIDGVIYTADGRTLVKYPQGKKGKSFDVPSLVIHIADCAFYEVSAPVTVSIPLTVETIDEMAFAYSKVIINYAGTSVPEKFKDAFAGHTVHVKLIAPGTVSKPAYTATSTTATISWKAVSGAHGYELHKYNTSTKKYELYKTTAKTSIKLTELKSATAYKYKVRAYVKGEETLYGAFSPEVKITTKPATVSKLTATATKASVTLKWSKVTGADGYRVYKYNSSTKKYEAVKTVTSTSVNLTGLKSGTTYKFKVRAFKKDGDTIYGAYSSVKEITTKLSAPSKVTSKGGTTSVKLTWSKSRGADGYRLYYKSGDSWKTLVKSVKGTSYTLKDIKKATKRIYAVRAYKKTKDGTIWSEYKDFSAATKPGKAALTVKSSTGGQATLTWKKVTNANTYRVYYKVNKGDYKLYKTYSKPTKVTIKNLKGGDNFTFKVQAGIKVTGGTVWGEAAAKSVKVAYRTTKVLKAMKACNYLLVTENFHYQSQDVIAIKGNKIYISAVDSYTGERYSMIYNPTKDIWYIIWDSRGVYTIMNDSALPEDACADYLIKSNKNTTIPTSYKTTEEWIEGYDLVCETATIDGYKTKFCYAGERLARVETDLGNGTTLIERIDEFSTTVPDSLFKVPAGYQYVEAEI